MDILVQSNLKNIRGFSYTGIVIDKKISKNDHGAKYIILNNYQVVSDVFYVGLYDFVEIGDSVIKHKDETLVTVVNDKRSYLFYPIFAGGKKQIK